MSTRSSPPSPATADPGPVPHPSLPSTPSEYPPIEPTGSLLLAYQLPPPNPSLNSNPPRPYAVLLIGGGAVAASRLYHLLCAGVSKIVLIAPREGVCEETLYRLAQCEAGRDETNGLEIKTKVEWRERVYAGEEDLETPEGEADYAMVLTAIDEAGLSSEICRSCRRRKIPVNVADVPPECDFYFGSVLRRGALSVMVSTNGKGPRVAARVRRRLEKALPETSGKAIENVGRLRGELRKIEGGKGKEVIERRMEYMSRVSDKWSLAQLGEMDERMMQEVLEGWERGEAKGYWDVNTRAYGGLGWVLSKVDKVRWWISPATVDGDPDRTWGERPGLIAAGGFVAGLAVGVGAAAAMVARRR